MSSAIKTSAVSNTAKTTSKPTASTKTAALVRAAGTAIDAWQAAVEASETIEANLTIAASNRAFRERCAAMSDAIDSIRAAARSGGWNGSDAAVEHKGRLWYVTPADRIEGMSRDSLEEVTIGFISIGSIVRV